MSNLLRTETRRLTMLALAAPLSALAPSCVATTAPPQSEDEALEFVPGGKRDNYYSDVATEFEVTGELDVKLTAEEFADVAVRTQKVDGRLTALGLYLTAYLSDKFEGIDENGDGKITEDEIFFHNMGYGDFDAMARGLSGKPGEVRQEADGRYIARFTMDMAGAPDLLSRIPPLAGAPATNGLTFSIQMPKGATMDATHPDSIPRRNFRSFDPRESDPEDLETVVLTATARATVGNAYPHFAEFTADGVLDITLFYGHDYNVSRGDLQDAREGLDHLRARGFTRPAATFEELHAASGPFVSTLKIGDRDVRVEVRIFHSDMFDGQAHGSGAPADRKQQHDLALAELVARDVFFYNGHSGPYYGFYLDKDDVAKVYPSEIRDAAFTPGRQQIFIAQGCQTYSTYAETLYSSPNKSEDDLDVITTVNYSYSSGTMDLFDNLIARDDQGRHTPKTFYEIIRDMNHDWINGYRDVFYGVMGIDGDPRLHPYAALDRIGSECSRASQCGDAVGNVCVARVCGARTLAPEACPTGTTFREFASGSTLRGGGCF